MPVGHTWKFDLELDFEEKGNFSKFRNKPIMLKFLATTENARKSNQKIQMVIARKLLEKHVSKNFIRVFTIITLHE